MPLDVERVESALLRIVKGSETKGTAFFVSGDGLAVTCHHVVAKMPTIFVQSGSARPTEAVIVPDPALAAIDLALLQCQGVRGQPLPLALNPRLPMPFWSKGYQRQGMDIRDAIPVEGSVTGLTAVRARNGADLRKVLVVFNSEIGPGMSGAPVLHKDWGVVVGVVSDEVLDSPRISGFAIPLSEAAERSERFKDVAAANGAEIPAYGPYLNTPAATEITARALRTAVRELELGDRVDLARHCARPAFSSAVDEFLRSDAPMLLVVGSSGVGKTTELAHLALGESRPTLLLSASGVTAKPELGLGAALSDLLDRTARDSLTEDALGLYVRALHRAGQSLLVLFDAINDSSELMSKLKPWSTRTILWLKDADARLIVTCRREYWEQINTVFNNEAVYAPPQATDRCMYLDDFDEAEARDALARYELAGTALDPYDVRHPLMAWIYWQQTKRGGSGPAIRLSRLKAIDSLIGLRCAPVAQRLGLLDHQVRAVLRRAAALSLANADLVLSRTELSAAVPQSERVVAGLVHEGLLVEHGDRFGFMFDEVGEFLQAEELGLDGDAISDRVRSSRESLRVGTLVFALLRLEPDSWPQAVHAVVENLLRREGAYFYAKTAIVSQLILQSAEPRSLYETLRWYIEQSVRNDRDLVAIYLWLIEKLRVAGNLDSRAVLGLLRAVAPALDRRSWESSHWDLVEDSSFTELAGNAIKSDPTEAFSELATWLTDHAIRQVAAGLLYFFADSDLHLACDALTGAAGEGHHALREIARRWPMRFLDLCVEWSKDRDVERRKWSAWGSHVVLAGRPDDKTRAAARALLRTLEADVAPAVQLRALSLLVADDETRDEAIDALIALVRSGTVEWSPYVFSEAVSTHFDKVLGVLTWAYRSIAEADFGLESDRRAAILQVFLRCGVGTSAALSDHVVTAVLGLLADAWSDRVEWIETWILYVVEYLLNRVDPKGPAVQGLLEFTKTAIADSGAARHTLRFVATGDGGLRAAIQRDVLDEILAVADDREACILFEAIGDRAGRMIPTLRKILARTPRDPRFVERCVVQEAAVHGLFAEALAPLLIKGEPYLPRYDAAAFVERVGRGEAPHAAAQALLLSETR